MDKDTAFQKMEKSRQVFLKMIERLNPEEMCQPGVEGDWCIKDLIAHVTSWEKSCLTPLQDYISGQPFQPEVIPDHLAWNDAQAAQWQARELEELLEDFHTTRRQLLEQAQQLSSEQWEQVLPAPWGGEGTLAQLLSGLAWHEMEHSQSIHKWLSEDSATRVAG